MAYPSPPLRRSDMMSGSFANMRFALFSCNKLILIGQLGRDNIEIIDLASRDVTKFNDLALSVGAVTVFPSSGSETKLAYVNEHYVEVWRIGYGKCSNCANLTIDTAQTITCLAVTNDQQLLLGMSDGSVEIWDAETNSKLSLCNVIVPGNKDNTVSALAMHANGKIAIGRQNGCIQIHDIQNFSAISKDALDFDNVEPLLVTPILQIKIQNSVSAMIFLSNGNLAVVSSIGVVEVYEVYGAGPVRHLATLNEKAGKDGIWNLAESGNELLLISPLGEITSWHFNPELSELHEAATARSRLSKTGLYSAVKSIKIIANSLTQLDRRLTVSDINALEEIIIANEHLTTLDIRDCILTVEAGEKLLEIIKNKRSITTVIFSDDKRSSKAMRMQITAFLNIREFCMLEGRPEPRAVESIAIPAEYLDCRTKQIMFEPVLLLSTHGVHEQEILENWFRENPNTKPDSDLGQDEADSLISMAFESHKLLPKRIKKFLDANEELRDSDRLFFSLAFKQAFCAEITRCDEESILSKIARDRRLLVSPLNVDNKCLLQLACETNPKFLLFVINLLRAKKPEELVRDEWPADKLRERFWELNCVKVDDGVEVFKKAALNLGPDGARIIGKKLEWTPVDYRSVLDLALDELFNQPAATPAPATVGAAAAESDVERLIKILLQLDIDFESKDAYGNTVLHRILKAVIDGKLEVEVLNLLLNSDRVKARVDVDALNRQNLCPIHLALNELNNDVNERNLSPIHLVLNEDEREKQNRQELKRKVVIKVVSWLAKAQAKLELLDNEGNNTVLLRAIDLDDVTLTEELIERGAFINAQSKRSGDTVLHKVVANLIAKERAKNLIGEHSYKLLLLLLIQKADPNLPNFAGNSPFHMAVAEGSLLLIWYLFINKGDAKVRNTNNDTVLHLAVMRGDAQIVDALVNPNKVDTATLGQMSGLPVELPLGLRCELPFLTNGVDIDASNGYSLYAHTLPDGIDLIEGVRALLSRRPKILELSVVLLKQGEQTYVYGRKLDGTWGITKLNAEELLGIRFPRAGHEELCLRPEKELTYRMFGDGKGEPKEGEVVFMIEGERVVVKTLDRLDFVLPDSNAIVPMVLTAHRRDGARGFTHTELQQLSHCDIFKTQAVRGAIAEIIAKNGHTPGNFIRATPLQLALAKYDEASNDVLPALQHIIETLLVAGASQELTDYEHCETPLAHAFRQGSVQFQRYMDYQCLVELLVANGADLQVLTDGRIPAIASSRMGNNEDVISCCKAA